MSCMPFLPPSSTHQSQSFKPNSSPRRSVMHSLSPSSSPHILPFSLCLSPLDFINCHKLLFNHMSSRMSLFRRVYPPLSHMGDASHAHSMFYICWTAINISTVLCTSVLQSISCYFNLPLKVCLRY